MNRNILLGIVIVIILGVVLLGLFFFTGFLRSQVGETTVESSSDGERVATSESDGNTNDLVDPITEDEEQVEEPTPTTEPTPESTPTLDVTPTPEPFNRCQLFDTSTTTLTLHDIPWVTTELTFFLTFDHPVYGLEEPVEGDEGEWDYSGILGSTPTEPCTFRDYPNRLYCKIEEFPESWWGTLQVLEVYVNGCDEMIYTHDRVSILKPACEELMTKAACEWVDGKYKCNGSNCTCDCP